MPSIPPYSDKIPVRRPRIRKLTGSICWDAEEALRELEELANQQYVSPTAFATIYLGLGQKDKCLDWLEKAYEQQDSACWYLQIDQIYDSVRNEPRFQALMQKVFGSNP